MGKTSGWWGVWIPYVPICLLQRVVFLSHTHKKLASPSLADLQRVQLLRQILVANSVLTAKSLALWVSYPKGNGFFALLLADVKWGETDWLLYKKYWECSNKFGWQWENELPAQPAMGPDWPHGKYTAVPPSLQVCDSEAAPQFVVYVFAK